MTDKIKITYLAFHISAVFYAVVGVFGLGALILGLATGQSLIVLVMLCVGAMFCIAIAVFVEVVVSALKRERFWAWVAGIVISGLYVPSLFLPLGVMGLVGLLDENVRTRFVKS